MTETVSVGVSERPWPAAPPAAPARPARAPAWPVIAVPAAVAAVLVFYRITGRALGFDEAATYAIASQHGAALWRAIAHDGGNMSAYYLLMHALLAVFGRGLLVLRFVSGLSAVAMVALVAALGLRAGGRRAGLIAGLLAAVSLPLVLWAQTARAYAPMLAFVCGGFLAFFALAEPDASGRGGGRRGAWLAYVACMTLACYCSFVAVLVVPVQLVALARRPGALRRLARALGVVAVLCVPLVILAMHRGSGQLFWVPRPSSMVDTQVLESITSAGLEATFHRTATTYLLIVVTLVALGMELLWVLWAGRRRERVWAPAVTLGWFAFPVVATFVCSLVSQPVFEPRDVLTTVPAGAVALGIGLADRRVPRLAAALAVVALVGLRGQQVVAAWGEAPEPWRAVTATVLSQSRPGDCIAFYPQDARSPFQYYLARAGGAATVSAPRSVLPAASWGAIRPDVERYGTLSAATIPRATAGCRRVWLISSHEGEPYGPPASRAHRARWRQLAANLGRAFGDGPARTDGYASEIHIQLFGPGPGPGR